MILTLEHQRPAPLFCPLTVLQSHAQIALLNSVNCSPPLTTALMVLVSCNHMFASAKENQPHVCVGVYVCVHELACICSLKGNASFDFLLITQHALCSVVNCPGPLFSPRRTGLERSESTFSSPLCLATGLLSFSPSVIFFFCKGVNKMLARGPGTFR